MFLIGLWFLNYLNNAWKCYLYLLCHLHFCLRFVFSFSQVLADALLEHLEWLGFLGLARAFQSKIATRASVDYKQVEVGALTGAFTDLC